MSQTRIVCTIGPATDNADMLRALHEAGMNVARLNGSHNTLDWHVATIRLLREVLPEVPILLDVPGRKVRTGDLAVEPVFDKGDTIVLTTAPGEHGPDRLPVNYPDLHTDLSVGDIILADDGTLRFTVIAVEGHDIHCRAEIAGQLRSRKGINTPFVNLNTKTLTDKDREMVAFACENGVDFVGISFVESAEHVAEIKALIGATAPRIVSKIESQGGLDRLEAIVDATDAVMIDRGDLSVETGLAQMAVQQKRILDVCRAHDKPVIVATEMLHTMIENPFPTKAEVSDITNAVLDGAAATMLSGETAIGEHPVAAVEVMRQVSDAATVLLHERIDTAQYIPEATVPKVMGDAVARVCQTLPVTKIVALTISGFAARVVACRRPRQPILAVSNDPMAARGFNLLPGTTGLYVDIPFSRTSTDHIVKCLERLWRDGKLVSDDLILVTAVGYPRSGNRMNLLQTHLVRDLVETLGWKK